MTFSINDGNYFRLISSICKILFSACENEATKEMITQTHIFLIISCSVHSEDTVICGQRRSYCHEPWNCMSAWLVHQFQQNMHGINVVLNRPYERLTWSDTSASVFLEVSYHGKSLTYMQHYGKNVRVHWACLRMECWGQYLNAKAMEY